jgi:hypothetical protein
VYLEKFVHAAVAWIARVRRVPEVDHLMVVYR